jgi:hypothetical protein
MRRQSFKRIWRFLIVMTFTALMALVIISPQYQRAFLDLFDYGAKFSEPLVVVGTVTIALLGAIAFFRRVTEFLYDAGSRSLELETPTNHRNLAKDEITRLVLALIDGELTRGGFRRSDHGLAEITDTIKSQIAKETIEDIERRFADEIRSDQLLRGTRERLDRLSQNLSRQLDLQDRKATLNLFIGMLIAAAGFVVLGWLTLSGYMNYQSNGNTSDFWMFTEWYIPKLTFVFIIEIFSYFFLTLYRAGLGEIKFFQNEITNLESKWASIQFAIGARDKEAVRSSIERLAHTERNFVLKKGERNASESGDAIPASRLADALTRMIKAVQPQDGGKAA